MYQDRIEYLKRAIKRTYKRYTGERTDGKATVLDVAKFFSIPIDEARMDDYVITNINCSTPSIEIIDRKNATSYTATYTGDADLLNFSGEMKFNKVVSISPLRKEEVLYYIGDEIPIITKMTFTDGEYDLVFEREIANSVGIFSKDGIKMAIIYAQNIVYDGRKVKQPLFNRIYKNSYKNKVYDGTFEQTYTYGPHHFIKWDDTQDKYAYIRNNTVIYGINELKKKGYCDYLRGVCFESTNIPTSDYFPLNMYARNYPMLNEANIKSAMMFNFRTEDGIHHSLQVYKCKDTINVMYHSKKYHYEGICDEETIANEEYGLPNLFDGTISSEEIQNVLSSIQARIDNNIVFSIISNELNTFGAKIDIRKGIVQEELDPLSPQKFINKSFDEICALVSANKDDYFRLIREQFETAINANGTLEKGQSKVLKPRQNKIQSSGN